MEADVQQKLDFEKKLPVRLPHMGLVPEMRKKINMLFSRYLDNGRPSLFDESEEIEDEHEVEIPESEADSIINATRKELEQFGLRAVKGADSITFNPVPEDDEQDKYWDRGWQ